MAAAATVALTLGLLSPPPARFDYVIVGGGTAGCVLANRLSADPSKSVLLLEPGASPRGSLKIAAPVALTKLFFSKWDWNFESEPTASTAGRAVHLCRGKCLGGSSATNALLYHRGTRQDFDAWSLDGWSGDEMLASFLAVEAQREETLATSPFHASDGLVGVEDAKYRNPLSSRFLLAAKQQGVPINPDFNDWNRPQEGVGQFQLHTRNGRRAHAAATHLRQAASRRNLHVRSSCRAARVVLDDDGRATGVVYLDKKGRERVASVHVDGEDEEEGETCGGEVVLCAGAIASPQLLMLSGIGEKEQLTEHGIETVIDLPGVGKNLADHPAVVTGYQISKPISITDEMFLGKTGVLNPRRILQWLRKGSGPLSTSGCDFGGFFRTSQKIGRRGLFKPKLEQADLQMRFVAGLGTSPDGVSSYRDIGKRGKTPSGITLQSVAIRPHARGSVTLASADVHDAPKIDPGFCTNAEDMATLREGLRLGRQLASQAAFDDVRTEEAWPCLGDLDDDDALDDYIRSTVHSANALAGTCKMGSDADDQAVVDTALRVKGAKGLRVVDASVIPTMPGGQLGATTFAIAERAAAIMLGES